MKEKIFRLYTEKKSGFDVSAQGIKKSIAEVLNINVESLREFVRYDVQKIDETDLRRCENVVFCEPQVDNLYRENLPELDGYRIFGTEYLPGQYDQRADSCMQCIQLLIMKERPTVKCARIYAVNDKNLNDGDLDKIKSFLINPIETQEAEIAKPETLISHAENPPKPQPEKDFIDLSDAVLEKYRIEHNLAMSFDDLKFVQDYFRREERNPYITELKILDVYWSDHCRHTTFTTEFNSVEITNTKHPVKRAYDTYLGLRKEIFDKRTDKYSCLMDIATIAMKKLKKSGALKNLDESDEINACSVKIKADINGTERDYLVMFKNETHNHPTEIEPFGGAATCLGGAIRDPLSGRVYVYQAMRITGAPNPFGKDNLRGKLPRRVLTKTAAKGFSSYGNQIGLATGIVHEQYHDGYAAKRLEAGFVVGAAPAENVVRMTPAAGDVVILLGGGTGRDGCGGATGSSKAQSAESLHKCGAEVQKGNPLTERKIQRLFRNPDCTKLIKRCNDFGAGGVCVAVGELADGVDINLSAIPKKYEGLSATELAISESQERMAAVISAEDTNKFISLAAAENLDATVIATVTDKNALRMFFEGECIADIKREMLNSAGIRRHADVVIEEGESRYFENLKNDVSAALQQGNYAAALEKIISDLNVCSQKGLVENFDNTIGSASVFVPLGGKYSLTPSQVMAAKLPVLEGETDTATVCSFGLNPDLASDSPFLAGVYAVVESAIKLCAAGVNPEGIYLSLQEYFPRMKDDPRRWGRPVSALLGAMQAQINLGIAAIGGKDSMSGSFENIDVPPTLISFAAGTAKASKLISNVYEKPDEKVYLIPLERDGYSVPDFDYLKKLLKKLHEEIMCGNVISASVTGLGGAVSQVLKSCFGNRLGFEFYVEGKEIFLPHTGDIVVSCKDVSAFQGFEAVLFGKTIQDEYFCLGGHKIAAHALTEAYTGTLESLFPCKAPFESENKKISCDKTFENTNKKSPVKIAKPKILIPVFPGTNCEYDTAKKFSEAGGEPLIYVIKNRSAEEISAAAKEMARFIKGSQIIAFPGGFSGGDEPDGSGKFIAAVFRSEYITEAVQEFLTEKHGLILGICNGFQALVKLGLLPYGKIKPQSADSATLTFNTINRHIAAVSRIRVASASSPWLAACKTGEEYLVPISHGEGRFVCSEKDFLTMINNGQIATQYAGFNPNGSAYAIEGITSADGRIFGKMGHSERTGQNLYKNMSGEYDMKIFESGIKYFG